MRKAELQEGGRWIIYLVVNLFVEVLDEDVALTRLAEGWVSLRPHDTARDEDVSEGSLRLVGVATYQALPLMRE